MSTELNTHLKKFLRTELNYCLVDFFYSGYRVLLTQLEPPEQLSARVTDKGSFFDVVI